MKILEGFKFLSGESDGNNLDTNNSIYFSGDFGIEPNVEISQVLKINKAFEKIFIAGGGLLVFPAGTFHCDVGEDMAIKPLEGVSVMGVGDGTLFKRMPYSFDENETRTFWALVGSETKSIVDVTIRDIAIDDNRDNMTYPGGNIANISGNTDCLDPKHAEHCHFENITVYNAIWDGFDFDYSSNNTIIGCRVFGAGKSGFMLGDTGNRVIGCLATNCSLLDPSATSGSTYNFGGFVDRGTRNVYMGNISFDNGQRNYSMRSSGGAKETQFVGNQSYGNTPMEDFLDGVAQQ